MTSKLHQTSRSTDDWRPLPLRDLLIHKASRPPSTTSCRYARRRRRPTSASQWPRRAVLMCSAVSPASLPKAASRPSRWRQSATPG
uniref:Uncharacterized protein n=1 Tax=Zea mays TaxID=4577 RepID=B8A0N1_MAIZE|nr:unknown [Zea mays]